MFGGLCINALPTKHPDKERVYLEERPTVFKERSFPRCFNRPFGQAILSSWCMALLDLLNTFSNFNFHFAGSGYVGHLAQQISSKSLLLSTRTSDGVLAEYMAAGLSTFWGISVKEGQRMQMLLNCPCPASFGFSKFAS